MASGLIILAEDDPMLRKLYRDLLETDGYTVIAARDGSEALAMLASNVPRLLILDVMMPGMDGIAVCRQVRPRLGNRVPILFLTALDDLDTLHACIAAGGDDYVVKSGSPQNLLQRVNYWLGSSKRPMAEMQRRRAIAHVEQERRLRSLSDPAEEALLDELSGETDPEIARMADLVRRAATAAGTDFGADAEERLFLVGYVSGIVDQAGDHEMRIKSRFRDYLRAVLRESGMLSAEDLQTLFETWGETSRDRRFAAAFRNGRRDADGDKTVRRFTPSGLREIWAPGGV